MTYETASGDRRPAGLRQRPGGGPVLPPIHQTRAAPRAREGFGLDELDGTGGIGLDEIITRYLEAEGVDVAGSLRNLQHAQAANARATANRAEALKGTARALRRARRALELEHAGWRAGWTGYTLDELTWRRAEVAELTEALAEGCGHDPETIAAVRSVAY
jgi:hypothetical protein